MKIFLSKNLPKTISFVLAITMLATITTNTKIYSGSFTKTTKFFPLKNALSNSTFIRRLSKTYETIKSNDNYKAGAIFACTAIFFGLTWLIISIKNEKKSMYYTNMKPEEFNATVTKLIKENNIADAIAAVKLVSKNLEKEIEKLNKKSASFLVKKLGFNKEILNEKLKESTFKKTHLDKYLKLLEDTINEIDTRLEELDQTSDGTDKLSTQSEKFRFLTT